MPSLQYPGDTPLARGTLFINDPTGGAIPYFEDWTVEVCDAEDDECLARCFDISGGGRSILVSKASTAIYIAAGIALNAIFMLQ